VKTCLGCSYANWNRTANGSLHPNGEGRCDAPHTPKPLPAAYYRVGGDNVYGGSISRRCELKTDCAYYQRKVTP